jgi:hypothetical protein
MKENITLNKKFWEELVTYFPWICHGPHRKPVHILFCETFSFNLENTFSIFGDWELKRKFKPGKEEENGMKKNIILNKKLWEVKSSQVKLLYNWRSVSQYVLVLSPIWDFWPEIFFLFLFFLFESYSLVLFGAPSLTRGRVCHLSVFCHFSL